jgi:phosphohistidine phosphatase
MKLYLVRHAEPKPETEDPKRPLSEKGWADIIKIARFIKNRGYVQVSKIMHSGKTRARQTAEVLAKELTPADTPSEVNGLQPLDDVLIWAERIGEITEDIMLVGHLPHLDRLCANLLGADENIIVNLASSGIICLERYKVDKWAIKWVLIPEII